jgi:hypothetical protein
MERAEPTEPMLSTEPTDPTERTDPWLAIESTEPSDQSERSPTAVHLFRSRPASMPAPPGSAVTAASGDSGRPALRRRRFLPVLIASGVRGRLRRRPRGGRIAP